MDINISRYYSRFGFILAIIAFISIFPGFIIFGFSLASDINYTGFMNIYGDNFIFLLFVMIIISIISIIFSILGIRNQTEKRLAIISLILTSIVLLYLLYFVITLVYQLSHINW